MQIALWMTLVLAQQGNVTDQAKAMARRSIIEYDSGEYVQALEDVKRAYELDPRPAFLFNIGQCERALGHHRQAAAAFKSFLREMPKAKNRARTEALVAEMTELAQKDDAAEKAKPAPSPPPAVVVTEAPPPAPDAGTPAPEAAVTAAPERRRHIPALTWGLGGGGLGVAIVGGVLFGLAESTLSQDKTSSNGSGGVQHTLPSSTYFGATTEGNFGEVLWAVGGALLVAGGVVAFTGGSK